MVAMRGSKGKRVTRNAVIKQTREAGGNTEQTEILIDYIEELWETVDLLTNRFGEERAQEIINATSHAALSYFYLLDEANPHP